MNYSLPLFALLSLTVSCTRYQYLNVQSTSATIQKNARNQFIAENDSLVVVYEFRGRNLPLAISITNKLDRPVMVDWKRSSVIINDKAFSMMPDEAVTSGAAVSGAVGRGPGSFVATDMAAVTSLPVGLQQIPPRSYITKVPVNLTGGYLYMPGKEYTKTRVVQEDGSKARAKEISFSEDRSPLKFRSFLTLVMEGEERKTIEMDHSFFVSGIVSTGTYLGDERPYLERSSVFTDVMSGVTAGALVAGAAVAVTAAENKKGKK